MPTYNLEQFALDPEKQKSRELIREKIGKTFLNDRSNLKVSFFTGPSLKESEEVYEKVGIKPNHIYGIERDKDIFKLVQAENQNRPPEKRIILYNGSFEKFASHGTSLDIISLDYIQNYGSDIINGINAVFENPKTLMDKTLLVVNTQARRESSMHQMRLRFLTFAGVMLNCLDSKLGFEVLDAFAGTSQKMDTKHLEDINELLNKVLMGPLIQRHAGLKIKDTNHLSYLRYGLFQEVLIRAAYPLLRELDEIEIDKLRYYDLEPEFKKLCLEKDFEFGQNEEQREKLRYLSKSLDDILIEKGNSLSDPVRLAYVASLAGGVFFPHLYNLFARRFTPKFGLNYKQAVHSAYLCNRLAARIVNDYSTFSYISSSNSPMLMHFFNLEARNLESVLKFQIGDGEEATRLAVNVLFSQDFKYKEFRAFLIRKFGRISIRDISSLNIKTLESFRVGQEIINKFFKNGKGETISYLSKFLRSAILFSDNDLTTRLKETDIMSKYINFVVEATKELAEGKKKEKIKKEMREYPTDMEKSREDSLNNYLSKIKEKYLRGSADLRKEIVYGLEKLINEGKQKDVIFENISNLSINNKDKIRKLNLQGKSPKQIHKEYFENKSTVAIYQIAAICAWNKIWKNKYPSKVRV